MEIVSEVEHGLASHFFLTIHLVPFSATAILILLTFKNYPLVQNETSRAETRDDTFTCHTVDLSFGQCRWVQVIGILQNLWPPLLLSSFHSLVMCEKWSGSVLYHVGIKIYRWWIICPARERYRSLVSVIKMQHRVVCQKHSVTSLFSVNFNRQDEVDFILAAFEKFVRINLMK